MKSMKIVKSELIIVERVVGFDEGGNVIVEKTGEKYLRHYIGGEGVYQWIDQEIEGEISP